MDDMSGTPLGSDVDEPDLPNIKVETPEQQPDPFQPVGGSPKLSGKKATKPSPEMPETLEQQADPAQPVGGSRKRSGKKATKPSTEKLTRNVAPNKAQKGDPSDVKSFLDVHDSEPRCAAYAGYKDIAEYRKFLLSHHFLPYYLFYAQHFASKTGSKSAKVALELLRDLHEPDNNFPANPPDALAKYPIVAVSKTKGSTRDQAQPKQNDRNSHYLLATVLYRFAESLENPQKLSVKEAKAIQLKAADGLSALLSKRKIPLEFDLTAVQSPALGPHTDLGEDRLERYNRAYNMLRSLGHSLALSRWKDKWTKPNASPYAPQIVRDVYRPFWMVPANVSPDDGSMKRTAPPSLPKKSMILMWDRETKTRSTKALEEHLNGFVVEEELSAPETKQTCHKDPRVYPTGGMWRDTVRRQLRLESLRLEFVYIRLAYPDADGTLQTMTVLAPHGQPAANWDDVKQALTQSSLEAMFTYTLKPIQEDEEFQLEYTGPPLALQDDLCIGDDGDIEQLPDAREQDSEEEAENAAFFSGGANSLAGRPPVPESEFSYEQSDLMLSQHGGYDVLSAEGLRAWQMSCCNKICGTQPMLRNEPVFAGNKKITKEQKQELAQLRASGEQVALSTDAEETADSSGRYYRIQAAFTGSDDQVGPPVEPCKTVFGLRTAGKHGQLQALDVSECDLLPGCDIKFLDSQIAGFTFMMQRSMGGVPVPAGKENDPDVLAAVQRLRSIRTLGGYLVDGTGFGKTITALAFASLYALYGDHSDGHRPILIVVPNGAVFSQWVDAIWDHFRDLKVIISNDDKPSESKYLQNWVSSTAMREAPDSLEKWPSHLRYVFDTKNPLASTTVFISPYDTHKDRTVETTWREKTKKSTGEVSSKKHHDEEPVFTSRWKGCFAVTINDEGHRLRHSQTKTYASIVGLGAPINWFLTATPVINTLTDILGGLIILWNAVKSVLSADKEASQWLRTRLKQNYEIFDDLADLPHDDIRRLIALDPHRIEALLLTEDVTLISKYYHVMDELISVRRSTASVLKRNDAGETIELRSMMPKHTVKTVDLPYEPEEETEAQWFHRTHARKYDDAAKTSALKGELISLAPRPGPDTHKSKGSFPATTAPLRRLTFTAKSTKLARLDLRMRRLGYNTLVKDMAGFRAKGKAVDWFVNMTHSPGDADTTTRLEKLQYLAEGSPTLRFILSQIRDYIITQDPKDPPRKLIIAEDTPIVAWFWEIVCNYLYIETKVLHSGLSNEERGRLVKEFNDSKSSVKILILMYNVGSQGTNLDPCCNRIIVATGAINAALEIQAWGRAIRVSQLYEVLIIRCKVMNSHDQARDSRQMDKAIMDMATRSWSPSIRQLLVELLNEANSEVLEAHQSVAGQEIIKNTAGVSEEDMQALMDIDVGIEVGAQPVEDDVNTGERQVRARKSVQRLIDDEAYLGEDFDIGDQEATGSDESENASRYPSESEYTDDSRPTASDLNSSKSSDSELEGNNDNPESRYTRDEDTGEITLLSLSRKNLKDAYRRLARKDQEEFDQDQIYLRQLLSLSPTRIYTTEDLEDLDVHDRALRLLYRARFGQLKEYTRIGPHIRYDRLHKDVVKAIDKKIQIQRQEQAYYAAMAKDGKVSKDMEKHKAAGKARNKITKGSNRGKAPVLGKKRRRQD